MIGVLGSAFTRVAAEPEIRMSCGTEARMQKVYQSFFAFSTSSEAKVEVTQAASNSFSYARYSNQSEGKKSHPFPICRRICRP